MWTLYIQGERSNNKSVVQFMKMQNKEFIEWMHF